MKRNKFVLNLIKNLLWVGIRRTSQVDYSGVSEKTIDLMLNNSNENNNNNSSILYVATHKSLWETVGIPYVINNVTGDVPYIFAGDNLFKNNILKTIFNQTGVIKVERGSVLHAEKLSRTIEQLLVNGHNSLIFPEGTRSRTGMINKFKSASGQGAIYAAQEIKQKGLDRKIYIVPVNTDYSHILDLAEMSKAKKSYNYRLAHSKKWFTTKLGKIYISMDDPIEVKAEMDRDSLAVLLQDKASDLVKILPINIYSQAIVQLNITPGCAIKQNVLYNNIEKTISDLVSYSDRFRGFDKNTNPKKIEELCIEEFGMTKFLMSSQLYKANIYANYINHYLDKK